MKKIVLSLLCLFIGFGNDSNDSNDSNGYISDNGKLVKIDINSL